MQTINELFTTFGVTWTKFFAQVILFVIVYVVLSKLAFGPVLAMLEERRKRIEEGQLNAEKIKKQLAEAELRYQEILRRANDEAQKLIDEARAGSEASSQKHLQQAIRDAEGIVAKAKESIHLERDRMVAEVRGEMIRLVVDTTAKVAGKVLTPEDQKRLSEETAQQLA